MGFCVQTQIERKIKVFVLGLLSAEWSGTELYQKHQILRCGSS